MYHSLKVEKACNFDGGSAVRRTASIRWFRWCCFVSGSACAHVMNVNLKLSRRGGRASGA